MTRMMEIDRLGKAGGASEGVGRNNGWKGYVPSTVQPGASIVMADDTDHKRMVTHGFTRIGKYEGDKAEGSQVSRSYYQSTVSGQNAYRQGVAQTVHATYQGVDARTGVSKTGDMGGVVTGAQAKNVTRRRMADIKQGKNIDGLPAGEYLIAILDADGAVVAYERPMAPERLTGLQRDTHLGRMLGVWSGRILEESQADRFNRTLVEGLKEIHDQQKNDGRGNEFVNVADPKNTDPVVRDAWDTMGAQIKRDAEEIFGRKGYLPVRRDMVNDAMGYRQDGGLAFRRHLAVLRTLGGI